MWNIHKQQKKKFMHDNLSKKECSEFWELTWLKEVKSYALAREKDVESNSTACLQTQILEDES